MLVRGDIDPLHLDTIAALEQKRCNSFHGMSEYGGLITCTRPLNHEEYHVQSGYLVYDEHEVVLRTWSSSSLQDMVHNAKSIVEVLISR